MAPETLYWVNLGLFWFLGALTPLALKSLYMAWHKRAERLQREEQERNLYSYMVYKGEGTLPLKVLLELIRHGDTMPARTLEITTYGRGVNGLLSEDWYSFCPDYKMIQKEKGNHYSTWFVVFCHEGEKEKFCSQFPEHVVHRDPFELHGERPERLPVCA